MTPYKFLLKFARRQPVWILITIILGWTGALFNGVSTTLIVPLLLGFLGQELKFEQAPPFLRYTLSLFDNLPAKYRLLYMMGIILLGILLKNGAIYASTVASAYVSKQLVRDIRLAAIKLLLDVDLDFYSKTKIGDVINSIGQEVSRAAGAIRLGIQMVVHGITILVFIAILISISWQLTLVAPFILVWVPVLSQFVINRSQKYGDFLSQSSRAFSGKFIEILNGIRLVKSTSSEAREYDIIVQRILDREEAELKSEMNYALTAPINEISAVSALLAMIAIGRVLFANQIDSLSAVLLTYLFVLNRMMVVVGQLNSTRSRFANAVPGAVIVSEFLRLDDKPIMQNGYIPYQGIQKEIRFEGVSFSYPSSSELVLDEINLTIPRGTTLALVGGSGAGKSTLADLVPRFYDPTAGKITIDGIDLRDYDFTTLRKAMGIVSQETFLFNDSVRNNISYPRPDASEAEIIQAAKQANAYDFIVQLPQGFDTEIGDRGVMLSGGQRQRIAIARALLSNPDILVLDEATSALDTVSEHLVQQAIERLSSDRTSIVIAHRLSTVQKADQIVVLEKGKIIEIGTHIELLKKGGRYTHLYSLQFSKDSQELLLKRARNETLMNSSYEIRTRLNPMIGFLRLLVDNAADSAEERRELTQEAYESAMRLLGTLEYLESSAKESIDP
ncbi:MULTISPECIES: ABC transporter ATP-binding protein [Planktothricoides]|uniref:histidine kinase n=2 Tax=Planktothricoides raciborskii TaxID=132608 RepID=A0AAU8JI82_9CYAN|nr:MULTISPECIES: ABC transporter ATP-binding protein [Planktothricoides]KOR36172.1 ABC transporter ATP-binding protein [Planktothricoides sp. SR001]MBD2543708.1 ATP-binding cassette domain-containing protein [Planktothricoides raciborskii FACHB-1370]MBD2582399.1 ATP-binding cassette domain-containing protein [Planktothricoides raciborskii FACHB-1261]